MPEITMPTENSMVPVTAMPDMAAVDRITRPRKGQLRLAELILKLRADTMMVTRRRRKPVTIDKNPLGHRVGPRHLPGHDARHRLDRIHLFEILEEQGLPGPEFFGLRIMREEPVRNF
jgi:hypothetical protein